jgi:hypothetical protein
MASETPLGLEQLSQITRQPFKNSYTVRSLKASLHASLPDLPERTFVPFLQERDGIGRLLPPLSEVSLKRKDKLAHSTAVSSRNSPSPSMSSAFNSTVAKTTRRRRKEVYPSPPIGLYDPKPAYELTAHTKFIVKTSSTARFANSHRKTLSVDYIDYDQINRLLMRRVSGFSIENQLAREKLANDYEKERAELYRPALKLPSHLTKFKGMFHVSDLKAEESEQIKKSAEEIDMKALSIKNTLSGLKDFSKAITRDMFKSRRAD